MPKIENLTCVLSQDGDPVTISVACHLKFERDEEGTPYEVKIEIVDDERQFLLGPNVLYTFRHSLLLLLERDHMVVNGTTAGVDINESRTFPRDTLDEDPGITVTGRPPFTAIRPNPDNFRARVTVSQVTEELSAIQTITA
ncbi:hypothetical protein ACTMTJ_43720 [Phytohabitans sp. LJ34]|uniref:hypothetical protein n=1 Tax=Phytohabitans sp. LJ34 TaxID=3452217 RepID=UPI003F88B03E